MSNKVRKTVSLNKTDPGDLKIINKIEQPGFNFNGWAREAMLEKICKEERTVVPKSESGVIKIVVG